VKTRRHRCTPRTRPHTLLDRSCHRRTRGPVFVARSRSPASGRTSDSLMLSWDKSTSEGIVKSRSSENRYASKKHFFRHVPPLNTHCEGADGERLQPLVKFASTSFSHSRETTPARSAANPIRYSTHSRPSSVTSGPGRNRQSRDHTPWLMDVPSAASSTRRW